MITFAEPAPDAAIRDAMRTWVSLLGEDRYEEALDMLYQGEKAPPWGVPDEYGGKWTPDLLRVIVKNYGLFELYEGYTGRFYKAVPLAEEYREDFEARLTVEWIEGRKTWGLDPVQYAGVIHVDLPLDLDDDYGAASDLTARFFIRRIDEQHLALELFDCHVM